MCDGGVLFREVVTVSDDRLMAQLDEAQYVRYDADSLLYVWYGGESTGIHVFNAAGTEVDYWQLEAHSNRGPTLYEVNASMGRHILGVDDA